jgi:glutaredoxin
MDIQQPNKEGFTIYSKSGCINCIKFKKLLKEQNIFFLEINCDELLIENKANFLLFISEKAKKEYKTFPMVFFNGEFIGGYNEAKEIYEINIKEKNKLIAFDDNSVFN